MQPKIQPQEISYPLFGIVVVSAFIVASLGALIGYEKVFFPFAN